MHSGLAGPFAEWSQPLQAPIAAPVVVNGLRPLLERVLGGALAISQRLRDISAELTLRGYVNERGRPFSAASIAAMLAAGLLKPTRMLT